METSNIFMEAKKSKDDNRTIRYIATKEAVDSMGRVFKVAGMDLSPLKKFKSIYWNHNTDDLPIGQATAIRKRKDEVYVDVKFAKMDENSFADTVYKLVRGGYINGGSIGISADLKWMDSPR